MIGGVSRYDFHMHTRRSVDSLLSPRAIIRRARQRGLRGIAVTDHDTIRGGLDVAAIAPPDLLVIVGAEIATEVGDIVGLFLTREIVAREPLAVLDEIEAQGGIAFLPHPHRGHQGITTAVLSRVTAFEALNGRAGSFEPTGTSRDGVPWSPLEAKGRLGCSDAHLGWEIGRAFTELEGEPTIEGVRAALLAGRTKPGGVAAPGATFYASQLIRLGKTGDIGMLWRFATKRLRLTRRHD